MGISQSNRRGRGTLVGAVDPTINTSSMTVDDVLAHVEEHPEDRAAALASEQAGKNRVTLVKALADTE